MRPSNIPSVQAVAVTPVNRSSAIAASAVVAANPANPMHQSNSAVHVVQAETVHSTSGQEIVGFNGQSGETVFQGNSASRVAAHYLRTGELPNSTILPTAEARVAGDHRDEASSCCTVS